HRGRLSRRRLLRLPLRGGKADGSARGGDSETSALSRSGCGKRAQAGIAPGLEACEGGPRKRKTGRIKVPIYGFPCLLGKPATPPSDSSYRFYRFNLIDSFTQRKKG